MGSIHWLDVVVVVVGAFYVWYAWGKGIYESLAELMTWLAVWVVLGVFWGPLSHYLVRSFGVARDWAPFTALLFLVPFVSLSVYVGLMALVKRFSRQHFSQLWHLLVGLPVNILAAGLMVMLLMLLFVAIPVIDFGAMYAESSWFLNRALEITASTYMFR